MKKSILSIVACSTIAFATQYTDAEQLLNSMYQAEFKCTVGECKTTNLNKDGEIDTVKIKEVIISLNKDFNFSYNKDMFLKNAKTYCVSHPEIENCEKNGMNLAEFELLKNLMVQTSKISLNDLTYINKETKTETSINNIVLKIDSRLKELSKGNKNFSNIKVSDLISSNLIELKGISSNKKYNLITTIQKFLPLSTKTEYDKNTGQLKKTENIKINEINQKMLYMYEEISSKIDIENLSDLTLRLDINKLDETAVNIKTNLIASDSISGKTEIDVSLDIRNILELLKIASKENQGFQLLSSLGTSIMFNELNIETTQNYLSDIHNKLLSSNKEYSKNYSELIKSINDNKDSFSFYEKYEYKLLSLEHKSSKIKIENNKKLNSMLLFQLLKEKDTLKITEEYK